MGLLSSPIERFYDLCSVLTIFKDRNPSPASGLVFEFLIGVELLSPHYDAVFRFDPFLILFHFFSIAVTV